MPDRGRLRPEIWQAWHDARAGGPPIAAATTDQLKARIEAARSLQA